MQKLLPSSSSSKCFPLRATFKESDGGQVHKMVTEIENLSQENKKLALKMKEKDAKLESQEGE